MKLYTFNALNSYQGEGLFPSIDEAVEASKTWAATIDEDRPFVVTVWDADPEKKPWEQDDPQDAELVATFTVA